MIECCWRGWDVFATVIDVKSEDDFAFDIYCTFIYCIKDVIDPDPAHTDPRNYGGKLVSHNQVNTQPQYGQDSTANLQQSLA